MGLHTDIPNAEYHASGGYSSSFVKTWINKSPAHAKYSKFKLSQSVADIGNAVHAMLLEPEKNMVISGPSDRRGNAWKEAYKDAEQNGNILLTSGDYYQVKAMSDSVMSNPHAAGLLEDANRVCEASILAKDPETGIVLKCRPDLLLEKQNEIWDVKTCQSADPRAFKKTIFDLGYDVSGAFYRKVCRMHGMDIKSFGFICVEKANPYATALYMLDEEVMDRAEARINKAIPALYRSEVTQDYPTGWEPIEMVGLPAWMKRDAAVT